MNIYISLHLRRNLDLIIVLQYQHYNMTIKEYRRYLIGTTSFNHKIKLLASLRSGKLKSKPSGCDSIVAALRCMLALMICCSKK